MEKQEVQERSLEADSPEPACDTADSQEKHGGGGWQSLAHLAVVRNIAIAVVMVLALAVVLYMVLIQPGQEDPAASTMPEETPSTVATAAPIPEPAVATADIKLPPEVDLPDRPELIEPPPEIMEKAMPPPFLQDINGEMRMVSLGNVATVESTPDYEHQVVTLDEDKYMHIYTFHYKCGHGATRFPDPYQNLMYKYPEKIADEYRGKLCAECEALEKAMKGVKAK